MNTATSQGAGARPDWLRVRAVDSDGYRQIIAAVRAAGLGTVCQAAGCPNIWSCFSRRHVTFLILGENCTRDCRFCLVDRGLPEPVDESEPCRVAEAVAQLGLRRAVITSVTRDDLADGGAGAFAATVREIRVASPAVRIELLIPDFGGSRESVRVVADSGPDIVGHNVETVPRLYGKIRPQARYGRSLSVLEAIAEEIGPSATKSGLMVGVGERFSEVVDVLGDLYSVGCRRVNVGQYLAPTAKHFPVVRYWEPAEFDELRAEAESLGFEKVDVAPLMRSSFS